MSNALSINKPTLCSASRSSNPANDSIPAWHAGFLQLLPAIRQHAQIEFRHLDPEARQEAVQEIVANALVAYVRLVRLGKQDVAYASPLARFAVAQYRSGRLVGARLNVRDVTSLYCQRRKSVVVERLDRWDDEDDCWREVLVEDRTCGPADLAASRIDFSEWITSLPAQSRRAAKLLATGERTMDVAHRLKLSPARVSQLRRELKESWGQFHQPAVLASDRSAVAAS